MKSVVVLGATGSVGRQALDVLAELPDRFRLVGLSGNASVGLLAAQIREFRPLAAAVRDPGEPESPELCAAARETRTELVTGANCLERLIRLLAPDIVLQAVSGAAGLPASIAAIEAGARLALANKESLVMAGHILMPMAQKTGAEIIPVDSEHSAILQARGAEPRSAVRRIFLTASGGPFIDTPAAELRRITPAEARRHPTWRMGGKITIDSATMMNKALEIIEARWLFDVAADDIEVVIHRQSIVHSMVEFADGSIIGQMGVPDMRVPIRYAFTYPERPASDRSYFDLDRFAKLTFERPDRKRFPAIDLGYEAARRGGLFGVVLNAANEAAVSLFIKGALPFDEISRTVADVMANTDGTGSPTLEEILKADAWAREEALRCTL